MTTWAHLLCMQTAIEYTYSEEQNFAAWLNILCRTSKFTLCVLALTSGRQVDGIMIALSQIIIPVAVPQLESKNFGYRAWSSTGAVICVILMVFVYLSFFGVV